MIHTKKVMILENDITERKILTEIVEKHKDVQVYATDNIGEAMEISLRNNIDLFFIDVVLDNSGSCEVLGMEFAKMIRKISQYAFTPIVLITCLDDPSMSAYRDIHCYSYLGKPIDYAEVEKVVDDALKYSNYNSYHDEKLFLKKDGIIHSIRMKDIVYVESHGGMMVIHCKKCELTLFYTSIDMILEKLKYDVFLKCNRSIVFNTDYLKCIDIKQNKVILVDGLGEFKISRKMKEYMLRHIKQGS